MTTKEQSGWIGEIKEDDASFSSSAEGHMLFNQDKEEEKATSSNYPKRISITTTPLVPPPLFFQSQRIERTKNYGGDLSNLSNHLVNLTSDESFKNNDSNNFWKVAKYLVIVLVIIALFGVLYGLYKRFFVKQKTNHQT